jgi:peptide/nickel transport system substrate-binding protein
MRHTRRSLALVTTAATVAALTAACGGGGGSSPQGSSSGGGSGGNGGAPQRGGTLVIDRTHDSQSMDATTVPDNESIFVFEQIFDTLYTVAPDGKKVVPDLATSYSLSKDKKTYTFHLRKGVKFSTGKPMTSADVKFSIDQARAAKNGWGYIDGAIKDVQAPDPSTVVVHTKYPWAPLLADISMFNNGVVPKDYAGKTKAQFYQAPVGTGPFKWGSWTKGQNLTLVRNPNYWKKGKPYLDKVVWSAVGDDNTRALQLQGGQAQIDEYPPFSSVDQLKAASGVKVTLFPSTQTDYIMFNEQHKPFNDVHVRRAISYAINRKALVRTVLFGNGKPANSLMPPQVPYYDPNAPGAQYNMAKAKQEMAKSSVPHGFTTTFLSGSGAATDDAIAQELQQSLKPLGIKVNIVKYDTSTVRQRQQTGKYDMTHSAWTMDIADPDELVSFAVDPNGGANEFFTWYHNPAVIKLSRQAEKTFDKSKRAQLYSQIQKMTANDAFMAFLYYSPYAYAYSDKVHGFQVYPTGNYHMENVWLSK